MVVCVASLCIVRREKNQRGKRRNTEKTKAPPAIPPMRPEEPPTFAACWFVVDANLMFRGLRWNDVRVAERIATLVAVLGVNILEIV